MDFRTRFNTESARRTLFLESRVPAWNSGSQVWEPFKVCSVKSNRKSFAISVDPEQLPYPRSLIRLCTVRQGENEGVKKLL